jgi:hypothetical protein
VDLDKWSDQSIEGLSRTADSDEKHLETDEVDTARDAVAEGQAMAVFIDWGLKDKGATVRTIPNIMADDENNQAASASDSPVLARAPLLLQQSLLFPYREGLNFEQVLLQDKGTQAAFAGTLDRPPSTSYEIMNPHAYEKGKTGTMLHMPDIHPLIDVQYEPYDVGAMGELDVRMLTELLGGKAVGAAMAGQWDGGLYYAAQSKSAKSQQQKDSTASVAILYLSQWRTESAAEQFATLYADSLTKKYDSVKPDESDTLQPGEKIFNTEEGPVYIERQGKLVFLSESFDPTLARKLQLLLTNAQNTADQESARTLHGPKTALNRELSSSFSQYLNGFGMMRAAMQLRPGHSF